MGTFLAAFHALELSVAERTYIYAIVAVFSVTL
jgi:hypothetical protein